MSTVLVRIMRRENPQRYSDHRNITGPDYAETPPAPESNQRENQHLVGDDEADEAAKIVDELERLFAEGHPDVEGGVQLSKCAILGRTRFALLAIEAELKEREIAFHKRLTANHENESEIGRAHV